MGESESTDRQEKWISVAVAILWACICAAVAGCVWGVLIKALDDVVLRTGHYVLYTVILLALVNAAHFLWGLFHVSDNIGEVVAEHDGPLRPSPFQYDRIQIRIFAFLTIGFSVYLGRAVERLKSK